MRDNTNRERDRDRSKERCVKEILRPVVMEEDSTTLQVEYRPVKSKEDRLTGRE